MSKVRNVLIAIGAFWLSLWVSPLLSFVFGWVNSKVIYDSVWFEAIAMGMMTSMGRAFAASIAAIITTMAVDAKKPQRWAMIVSVLYIIDAPVRYGPWHITPTAWDRASQAVDLIWPAIACSIAAVVASHLQQRYRSIEH